MAQPPLEERLQDLLITALQNPHATFREGQREAIESLLKPPFRSLVVQATGWGKSLVYFLATRVLRDRGLGPTLVISPLLSLIRDQVLAAERLQLKATRIDSTNKDDWEQTLLLLARDEIDLLYIAPERLANTAFQEMVPITSLARTSLVVIDEAHCISDWGHDFRPDYRRIGSMIRNFPPTTAVLALTATANTRVIQDIQEQIGGEVALLRGSLARASLQLQTILGFTQAERLAWLATYLPLLPHSGIVYTLTQHDADTVARWLQSQNIAAFAYHAALENEERVALEQRLLNNEVKTLVATVALGMGFDKPDLGFVIHYQSPGNLVAYYQQIGRAGRAISEAVAILFWGDEDEAVHEWFMERALPPMSTVERMLDILANEPQSIWALEQRINRRNTEIQQTLKYLQAFSPAPIVMVEGKYQRTPVPFLPDTEHERLLKERRMEERRRFTAFMSTQECLMECVLHELEDSTACPCGRCANCLQKEIISREIPREKLLQAEMFLRRSLFPIPPRKQWKKEAFPVYGFQGNIKAEMRFEEGICLSRWGSSLVARWVRQGKQVGRFNEELLLHATEILQRVIQERGIEWVCAVPSLRTHALVPDFAKRLAEALHLEYVEAIVKTRETLPQKVQNNSFYQSHNLDGVFEVVEIRTGKALLVDDMVDSRWTFTVLSALLRGKGVEGVMPFALCTTSSGESDT